MPGIGSAATSVLIGHVGAGTSRIRIGAGGIMLPNHAPLQVAEQFGTLEALFPGRIDLGLGRAPGTDQAAAFALRRTLRVDPNNFPNDVLEVMEFLADPRTGAGRTRGARRRPAGAHLDSRVQHVRRRGSRGAGPAVRVRLALRARDALRGDRHLSGALPAIGPAGRAVRDAGGERGGGGHRRRGAIPGLVGAPVVRQPCAPAGRSSCHGHRRSGSATRAMPAIRSGGRASRSSARRAPWSRRCASSWSARRPTS